MSKWLLLLLLCDSKYTFGQTLEIFELEKKCMIEAKQYFNEHRKELTAQAANEIITTEFHFNKKSSICLLRVKRTPSKSPIFLGDSIHNVLENKLLFMFFKQSDGKNSVFTCIRNSSISCTSESEYMLEANRIMSE